jgi:hypothetical protein
MYHTEKEIDGVLHWKGTPNGKWKPYTPEQLTKMLLKEREYSIKKSTQLEELQERVGDLPV